MKEKKLELKVAVLSDLHAYYEADTAPSNLCIKDVGSDPNRHPIAGLHELFKREKVRTDLLLCGGDMGDKALPLGIRYVWDSLQSIRISLGAKRLAATTGNHDVDSRYEYNQFDAKGILQALEPSFPVSELPLCDKYWARNYVVVTEAEYRLVILNTSAYHGHRRDTEQPAEYNHGRVARSTVDAVRHELMSSPSIKTPVNILLCHHHPHKFGDIEEADYSAMEGAEMLINLLGSGEVGEWIIVHGHKHHPRIAYASGDAIPPIVFSAGSLCAAPYRELASRARNQFHILTFPLDAGLTSTFGLVGTFESWDWATGKGWISAGQESGLPAVGGFGYRGNIKAFAAEIASAFPFDREAWIDWKDVEFRFPQARFILPGGMELLRKTLLSSHSIESVPEQGRPRLVGKRR